MNVNRQVGKLATTLNSTSPVASLVSRDLDRGCSAFRNGRCRNANVIPVRLVVSRRPANRRKVRVGNSLQTEKRPGGRKGRARDDAPRAVSDRTVSSAVGAFPGAGLDAGELH